VTPILFLTRCADEIEKSNGQWQHEHVERKQTGPDSFPSFIVYNSNTE